MSTGGHALGYDATPALSVPLRFFVTAPLFGLAAGLMLLVAPDLLQSRWTPGALALTHLITVGFMLMVIVGALFQILPVVCGAEIPGARPLATLLHPLLVSGTVTLVAGLYAMQPPWLILATALLSLAFALFLAFAVAGLWRTRGRSDSQRDLRAALLGLAIAIGLGVTLALILACGLPIPLLTTLDLHVGWALLGGLGVLVAATSWIVVPMFHITPPYPLLLSRYWTSACLGALVVWSLATIGESSLASTVSSVTLFAMLTLAGTFALATLRLQSRTRRRNPDASFGTFRFGMLCLLAGILVTALIPFVTIASLPVIAGVLLLHGGFTSVIQAMLYKIVPFLCWLHLTQAGIKAPNMRLLMPESRVWGQLRSHTVAVVALLLASITGHDLVTRAAGVAIIVSFAWLFSNQLYTLRTARQARRHNRPLRNPGATHSAT